MKKTFLTAALVFSIVLFPFLILSCISFTVSKTTTEVSDGGEFATVKGLLEVDENGVYYISLGGDPAYSNVVEYDLVKDDEFPDAWHFVKQNPGKHVTVEGYVVKKSDDKVFTLAVQKARQWVTPQ
ncbi:MAG: hypothetical protein K6A42_02860 [Treponema sp.]|nr:hypothetical protein [Treponema sp.]